MTARGSSNIVQSRPPIWRRAGFLFGAVLGVLLGTYLEWYFNFGPASTSPDRGAAQGFGLLVAGFPFTMLLMPLAAVLPLAIGRLLLILGVGATWATVGLAFDTLVRARR